MQHILRRLSGIYHEKPWSELVSGGHPIADLTCVQGRIEKVAADLSEVSGVRGTKIWY